ncbi:MAG: flagellar brake protein [Syntrophaceae bacterium]|nr:flagellar brake protein [Syntrophaceae bacterium]
MQTQGINNEIIDSIVENTVIIPVGTFLKIDIEGISYRLNSEIVGYEKSEYLIIKMPKSSNINYLKTKFYRGNKIIIRYLDRGTVYRFETEIIGIMYDPARLILTKYPKIVSEYDLRDKRRYECFIPAQAKLDQDTYLGMIVDISENGCLLMLKASENDKLPASNIGDQFEFTIVIPGTDVGQKLSMEIRNIKRDSNVCFLGGNFIQINEELKKTMADYISIIDQLSSTGSVANEQPSMIKY